MSHIRVPLRRAIPALLTLAAVCAALPLGAQQAAPTDSVLRGFERTGDYMLMVDGKADLRAEVYQNKSIPAWLVLPTTLPSPILLMPGAGSVETVQMLKVVKQKNGTVDLLADAQMKPQGKFKLVGERVEFTSEGRKASLSPKPPLVGQKKAAQLKEHSPEYIRTAQGYTPNAQAVAALKKQTQQVRVLTFFGSWCPHCKDYVPYLMRVEEDVKNPKIQFDYRGLPRDFNDAEAKRLNVREVPTAIVYVNGREVGRLSRNDWRNPEGALTRLLNGAAKTGK
jgi:thiol-disulfide isomerase/thioredoxin